MKTYTTKSAEIERHWKLVDADGATLGRLATRVATLLRGKHKPSFSPHLDTGAEHPHAAQKPQQLGGSAPQPPTNTSVLQPPTDTDKGSVPQPVAGAEPSQTPKES